MSLNKESWELQLVRTVKINYTVSNYLIYCLICGSQSEYTWQKSHALNKICEENKIVSRIHLSFKHAIKHFNIIFGIICNSDFIYRIV